MVVVTKENRLVTIGMRSNRLDSARRGCQLLAFHRWRIEGRLSFGCRAQAYRTMLKPPCGFCHWRAEISPGAHPRNKKARSKARSILGASPKRQSACIDRLFRFIGKISNPALRLFGPSRGRFAVLQFLDESDRPTEQSGKRLSSRIVRWKLSRAPFRQSLVELGYQPARGTDWLRGAWL